LVCGVPVAKYAVENALSVAQIQNCLSHPCGQYDTRR
jgi:hypothetical protein